MRDRHVSRTLNGNVRSSCVKPAYLYSLETMAMTEKQQEKQQVCENNWVRRIEEMREEVCVKESLIRKLVRSGLKFARHVERMDGNG